MPNRLLHETSPYLLQHAQNPVNWYAWGPEALARSGAEQKPIFLSIGYSACHWCHVMEHESFENADIAAYLNEHFISIKVDREERPDLDQVYMNAVQLLTGRGGWPMSVFLTPELKPFFGGTYWPPDDSRGMPGFPRVLSAVMDAWNNRREQAVAQAGELTAHIQALGGEQKGESIVGEPLLVAAAEQLLRACDRVHGGFGGAPKFPHAMHLQFLMRMWKRTGRAELLEPVTLGLDKMARGGIYDHLGGGFARYAVDERWLVPHFEKMLYDNALLTGAYLDGFLVTGNAEYARVVRETCDYILRDMTDASGGFHSSEDADSEGEEGKFYVWTPAEIEGLLGPERAERFCAVYDVSPHGNFEHGQSILHLAKPIAQVAALHRWNAAELEAEMAETRSLLLTARSKRVRPGKDDKILANWNALMIEALARAGSVLGEPRYVAAAEKAATFLLAHMRRSDGRLQHSYRAGQAKVDAFLDDYASLATALIALYEATFHEGWIEEAVKLLDTMLKHFRDTEKGGFYFTADDQEQLIARHKDLHDSSVPSGCAQAALALLRIGKLCGRADYLCAARETLDIAAGLMEQAPLAAGQMLNALDTELGPFHEIVILGDVRAPETSAVLSDLRRRFLPNAAVACRAAPEREDGSPDVDPIFLGKHATAQAPAVFICEDFTCHTPVSGVKTAQTAFERLAKPGPAEEVI